MMNAEDTTEKVWAVLVFLWSQVKTIFKVVYNILRRLFYVLADLSGPVANSIRTRCDFAGWSKVFGKAAVMGGSAEGTAQYGLHNYLYTLSHDQQFWLIVVLPAGVAFVAGFIEYLAQKSHGVAPVATTLPATPVPIEACPYRVLPGAMRCQKCFGRNDAHPEDRTAQPFGVSFPRLLCNGEHVIVS